MSFTPVAGVGIGNGSKAPSAAPGGANNGEPVGVSAPAAGIDNGAPVTAEDVAAPIENG